MMNLFSSFDPSSSLGLSLNWFALGASFGFLPLSKWLRPNRWSMWVGKLSQTLSQEIKPLLSMESKASSALLIGLFYWIGLSNLMGLFPYFFTATSHLAVSLSLALPLWAGGYLQGWLSAPKKMLAHLTPSGTPYLLMPFMVVIEVVSNAIRPGTLAVRLAANMIAGHLLLILMSDSTSVWSAGVSVSVVATQVTLVLLETAVAVIQAYVFTVLSALYIGEV